jgi:WD40 repeat protein
VHRARYDKTRQWFIKKSQAQWWGSLLPDPRAVSVKNWERLFKSVVHVSSQSENGRQVNAITPSTLDQPQKGSSSPGGSSAASVPPSSGAAAAATSPTALSRVELGEDVQSASVEGLRCRLGMRCKGHGDHVTVVAWSSDGRHVVSGSKESKVLVWAVPNTNLLELGTRDSSGRGDNNHNGNDGPSSSSSGGNSLNDGRSPMGGDAADSGAPTTLAAASRVGSGDLTPAEVAKAMTMGLKPAEELAMGREANWTMACCFSPSNRRVAVAGLNQKISVGDWRFQHGRNYALHPVGNGDEHLGSVTSLCFMGASDSLLASGCSDSYLRVWDLGGSGKMVTRLSAQEDEVLCLAGHAWAPHLVMSGGADCVVRLHDVRLPNGPSTVCTLRGAESDVEDVRAFGASSTTANFLAAASRDGHLRVHDVRYPKAPAMTSLVTEPRGYTAVDFSPDGRWLFAAVAGGHAWQVMDAYTGRVVLQVRGHGGVVSCLRATNDGRVITGGDDHQLCVWNVDTPHFW